MHNQTEHVHLLKVTMLNSVQVLLRFTNFFTYPGSEGFRSEDFLKGYELNKTQYNTKNIKNINMHVFDFFCFISFFCFLKVFWF